MKKILILLLLAFTPVMTIMAQDSEKSEEEKLYEIIQKQIDNMSESLKLDDAQIFFADSIMVHDYNEMQKELKALSDAKVYNSDIYVQVQDKWMEKMYVEFEKLFTPEQWGKYLKLGAAREKKARDKRAAKSGK